MPEAPELEVVREYLTDHIIGAEVTSAEVIKPSVLRCLIGDMPSDITGKTLENVERRGKFLLLRFSDGKLLAVNPMLTGAIQYCLPKDRMFKRTCFKLSLSSGYEMRYLDDKQMGIVYYSQQDQIDKIPRLSEQGPDVLDDYSFDEFKERLKPFHGEIKGILTRGRVISGIGNAYSDEILFAAGIYPFRKRKAINPDELRCLYDKSREVVEEAIPVLRERMGDNMHTKVRDILKVHNKGGSPCPRCGNAISQLTANKRITSYCRKCQPGMLLKN